jgi:hypothetical protein
MCLVITSCTVIIIPPAPITAEKNAAEQLSLLAQFRIPVHSSRPEHAPSLSIQLPPTTPITEMIANTMSLLLGILSTFLRKSSKLKGDFRPKENFEQKLIYISLIE